MTKSKISKIKLKKYSKKYYSLSRPDLSNVYRMIEMNIVKTIKDIDKFMDSQRIAKLPWKH